MNLIFDALLQNGCDRKTVLFAWGRGGRYDGLCRRLLHARRALVQVPTTLLAQVDSLGRGKTAINHPLGKNMIGAFYQPLLVVCDLSTLDTFAAARTVRGLAEVIKYGPIADMAFLEWLETSMDALPARDKDALAHAQCAAAAKSRLGW